MINRNLIFLFCFLIFTFTYAYPGRHIRNHKQNYKFPRNVRENHHFALRDIEGTTYLNENNLKKSIFNGKGGDSITRISNTSEARKNPYKTIIKQIKEVENFYFASSTETSEVDQIIDQQVFTYVIPDNSTMVKQGPYGNQANSFGSNQANTNAYNNAPVTNQNSSAHYVQPNGQMSASSYGNPNQNGNPQTSYGNNAPVTNQNSSASYVQPNAQMSPSSYGNPYNPNQSSNLQTSYVNSSYPNSYGKPAVANPNTYSNPEALNRNTNTYNNPAVSNPVSNTGGNPGPNLNTLNNSAVVNPNINTYNNPEGVNSNSNTYSNPQVTNPDAYNNPVDMNSNPNAYSNPKEANPNSNAYNDPARVNPNLQAYYNSAAPSSNVKANSNSYSVNPEQNKDVNPETENPNTITVYDLSSSDRSFSTIPYSNNFDYDTQWDISSKEDKTENLTDSLEIETTQSTMDKNSEEDLKDNELSKSTSPTLDDSSDQTEYMNIKMVPQSISMIRELKEIVIEDEITEKDVNNTPQKTDEDISGILKKFSPKFRKRHLDEVKVPENFKASYSDGYAGFNTKRDAIETPFRNGAKVIQDDNTDDIHDNSQKLNQIDQMDIQDDY